MYLAKMEQSINVTNQMNMGKQNLKADKLKNLPNTLIVNWEGAN